MARGPRKTLEEKIAAKEELIQALKVRIQSENEELQQMYQEKRLRDLESLSVIIEEAGLTEHEVQDAIHAYVTLKVQNASQQICEYCIKQNKTIINNNELFCYKTDINVSSTH